MKVKIMFSMMLFLLTSTSMFAVGFPVTRAQSPVLTEINSSEEVDQITEITSPAATAGKDQVTALLLWFFLGGFAAHRWYLGSPIGWNILYIFTAGFLVVGYIIDLVDIITKNYPGL